MARLTKQTKDKFKILDPGCGTAILSSSFIETLAKENGNLKEIELVVYETDQDILPYTQAVLDYLGKWLKQYKIKFEATLDTNDFVLENKDCFQVSVTLFSEPKNATYYIVIKLFKSWAGSLRQYDIQISTGPVVSFYDTSFQFPDLTSLRRNPFIACTTIEQRKTPIFSQTKIKNYELAA